MVKMSLIEAAFVAVLSRETSIEVISRRISSESLSISLILESSEVALSICPIETSQRGDSGKKKIDVDTRMDNIEGMASGTLQDTEC